MKLALACVDCGGVSAVRCPCDAPLCLDCAANSTAHIAVAQSLAAGCFVATIERERLLRKILELRIRVSKLATLLEAYE
jgi:hypothetical protein